MPTRTIVVTDHQAALLQQLVASGRYQNASEVLRHGLRLVEAEAEAHAAKVQRFRGLIQEGLDDLARGDVVTFDSPEALEEFFAGLVEGQTAPA